MYVYFLQPKAAEKSTAKPKASSGITMFFGHQTGKAVKQKVSVSKDSPENRLIPQDSEGNEMEVKCESKRDWEKPEDSPKKLKVFSNVKNSSIQHTEKKGGRGKSKKMNTDEELQPAKKRKRIIVMSDSEDSSDEGE